MSKQFLGRGAFILPLLFVALVWLPKQGWTNQEAAHAAPVVATYQRELSERELHSWLAFQGRQEDADRATAIQEMLLVSSLADEAIRLGLDRLPRVHVEIERQEAELARSVLKKNIAAAIHISDEEAEAKYHAIKDTYTRPRRLRLRNIFKRYPPDADAAAKTRVRQNVEELRRQLLTSPDVRQDFITLAETQSDSQTRLQGGLIGNAPSGTFRPEVDAVAMALQEGEISPILTGPDGVTILYCEQILDKVTRSPEELRRIARNLLENRMFEQRWEQFEAGLLPAAAPQYHWRVLAAETETPQAVLVTYTGGTLSVAEVKGLFGPTHSPATLATLAQIPREGLTQRIETALKDKMILREVSLRGLAERDGLADKRQWTRRQVLATQALTAMIQHRLVPPTEAEIKQFYTSHQADFIRPLHYRVGVISLPIDLNDIRQTYRQAARLVHDIQTGTLSFSQAAGQYSQHPSAANGGQVGWVSQHAFPQRFGIDCTRALKRLKVGEMSDVVSDGQNLWILQLHQIEQERPMRFEEAKPLAENRLGNQRVRMLEAEITKEWLEKLHIEIRAGE